MQFFIAKINAFQFAQCFICDSCSLFCSNVTQATYIIVRNATVQKIFMAVFSMLIIFITLCSSIVHICV